MFSVLGRMTARVAVFALASLGLWPMPASAEGDQVVKVSVFFDLNGNGARDEAEELTPPSSWPPHMSGWSVLVDLYKVDENGLILATSWVPFGAQWTNNQSVPLTPGHWVAVMGNWTKGSVDAAPASWSERSIVQTWPLWNQALEFDITDDGATPQIQFGIGPSDPSVSTVPPVSGPRFDLWTDTNYNQRHDVAEAAIPDGLDASLTAVHWGPHNVSTTTTAGGMASFPMTSRRGAFVLTVPLGSAAGTPTSWWVNSWVYAESIPSSVQYLIFDSTDDDCDPDPLDDNVVTCVAWPTWGLSPFAFLPANAALTGSVFWDKNANGIRDVGEKAPPSGISVATTSWSEYQPTTANPTPFKWPAHTAVVQPNGSFDLGTVPPGTFDLVVSGQGWHTTTATRVAVVAPGTTIEIGVTPQARPAPLAAVAAKAGRKSVTLTWTPGSLPNRGQASEFYVRQLVKGRWKVVKIVNAPRTKVKVTGLAPGKPVSFKVIPHNSVGFAAASRVVKATPTR